MNIIAITISSHNVVERHRIGVNNVVKISGGKNYFIVFFNDDSYAAYPKRNLFSLILKKQENDNNE